MPLELGNAVLDSWFRSQCLNQFDSEWQLRKLEVSVSQDKDIMTNMRILHHLDGYTSYAAAHDKPEDVNLALAAQQLMKMADHIDIKISLYTWLQ